jgi:hypothetical protein
MMGAMLDSGQLPPIGMVAAASIFVALAIVAAEVRAGSVSTALLLLAGLVAGAGIAQVLA